ncbi:MAG: D-alanine--D-alanine ligase family protein [Bacillota bacterium]|nr:D-alanine--D-alanine ligase family protein [Bacillota bacterium]
MAQGIDEKKKVMILFGGVSSEHEVSRVSAASVLTHIDTDKYDVLKAGITKEGLWYLTEASAEEIASGAWENHSSNKTITVVPGQGFQDIDVDVVFPVLHGKNGEDGRMQGFLRIAGLPFVGSDSTSSAACMDKAITKAVVEQAEACLQAKCCVAHKGCDEDEAAGVIDKFFYGDYPLFVKPANSGSSVGITKVKSKEEISKALSVAFAEDTKALVEEMIEGRELEVAVLGGVAAKCIGEIFAANEFYDYNAKYDDVGSETTIVKDLSEEMQQEIRDTAVNIYEAMGCRGLARVDFFLEAGESGGYDDGILVFNEINTLPGFTSISMYPQLWEESGLPYSELIDRLVDLALKE